MIKERTNDPLHGITLEMILNSLIKEYSWDELGALINIRCFNYDPSIRSSLKFLRRTPWARKKVEVLYLKLRNTIRPSTNPSARPIYRILNPILR